jgi:uncharacterized protein (TIGR03435 family)
VNVPLQMLITFAFDIRDHQLVGAPAWLVTERYDIQAKAPSAEPGSSASFDANELQQVKRRLQNLLAGRFRLMVRQEIREQPLYALMVGKDGPRLQSWKEGDERGPQIDGRTGFITCWKVDMKTLAADLSRRLGRTVVDNTGLAGEYNFKLQYVSERPTRDSTDIVGPTLIDALFEQLGLKLESRRGPVEVLVIEHIERPTAN